MKNYLPLKEKYNNAFADAMVTKLRNLKYGITPCFSEGDFDLITMRKELVDWQSCGDFQSLCEVRRNYKTWLPVNFGCDDEVCYVNINITEGAGKSYHISPAQAVWTFTHDLGFNPNVTTTDENGQQIYGTVTYLNNTTVEITFSQPVAGWAYLS